MKAKFVFVPMQTIPAVNCWCIYCDSKWRETIEELEPENPQIWSAKFIVCPDCGNKRCPRATYHEHGCTRSNEPGQEGSVYGGFTWETA